MSDYFGSLGNCVTIFGKFSEIFWGSFCCTGKKKEKKRNEQNCVLFFGLPLRWFGSFPVNTGHTGV